MTNKIYQPLKDQERIFEAAKDGVEIIRWLRDQGQRGIDWEFSGHGRRMGIWFHNESLEALFILRWL